jgi:hypothetical protein
MHAVWAACLYIARSPSLKAIRRARPPAAHSVLIPSPQKKRQALNPPARGRARRVLCASRRCLAMMQQRLQGRTSGPSAPGLTPTSGLNKTARVLKGSRCSGESVPLVWRRPWAHSPARRVHCHVVMRPRKPRESRPRALQRLRQLRQTPPAQPPGALPLLDSNSRRTGRGRRRSWRSCWRTRQIMRICRSARQGIATMVTLPGPLRVTL